MIVETFGRLVLYGYIGFATLGVHVSSCTIRHVFVELDFYDQTLSGRILIELSKRGMQTQHLIHVSVLHQHPDALQNNPTMSETNSRNRSINI